MTRTHTTLRIVIYYNDGHKEVLEYDKVHRHNLLLIMLDLEYLKHQGKIKDYEFYYDIDLKNKMITDYLTLNS